MIRRAGGVQAADAGRRWLFRLAILLFTTACVTPALASVGDRLSDFRDCLDVCAQENCQNSGTYLPLHLRLLLWNCQSNCDYTCQHVVTRQRLEAAATTPQPIVQFHGKWPFYRFLGMQEPFSVLFSFLNLYAHWQGMQKIRSAVPATYPLRPWYMAFGYFGLASWIFSMIFHTRDFIWTEKLDYFAAGASVFYGLYYTPIRIFRMDRRTHEMRSLLRAWTVFSLVLYLAHVSYLTFWTWDYTYNMAANVTAGIVQNALWSWFSIQSYQRLRKPWAAWPGLIVAWIILAMSLELLDFPPFGLMIDAHSLWHLGTVLPTIWWYNFLTKDSLQDIAAGAHLKA